MKPTLVCFAIALGLTSWSQVRADWNSTIAASNPLNWYQFNELSGSLAVDHGSQQLDGTYGTGALDATRGAVGLVGVAAEFGNQSTIFLNGSQITGDWTAEFVLKRIGSKSSSVLIRGVPFAFPSTALKLEQFNNTGQVGYTQYGAADRVFAPPVFSPLDEWIHLVYVKTGLGMNVYLDGVLAGTNPSTIVLQRYQIGSHLDTIPESPLAIMDEAVIYNRALSPAEVALHFAAVPEPSSFTLAACAAVSALAYVMHSRALRGRKRAVSLAPSVSAMLDRCQPL